MPWCSTKMPLCSHKTPLCSHLMPRCPRRLPLFSSARPQQPTHFPISFRKSARFSLNMTLSGCSFPKNFSAISSALTINGSASARRCEALSNCARLLRVSAVSTASGPKLLTRAGDQSCASQNRLRALSSALLTSFASSSALTPAVVVYLAKSGFFPAVMASARVLATASARLG